jgi:hypothetical protein
VLDGIGGALLPIVLLLLGGGKRFNGGELPKFKDENGIELV